MYFKKIITKTQITITSDLILINMLYSTIRKIQKITLKPFLQ